MPNRFHLRRLAGFVLAACAVGSTAFVRAADTPSETPSVKPTGPGVKERLSIARTAIDAKDWNKALSELNLAAKEDPRNADVQNLLGYSYRKRSNPDLAKAFEHYKEALRLNPNHKGAHEYIGEAYLMDKKPAEAQKHLVQLEAICGNKTSEEYADLAKSIAEYNARAATK
ncbi:tetratricopeptide repeat protein [Candidatus Skiveiella danica]|jgi:tetratricopeptide (TPR) repeat protein|uniref:tetratricopeptide repeat protein n=1 Tax=Candidatus Skiveiella danica TaxID=3386177 RepID=UPI0009D28168|nr:MAG: Tetratricopeptide repeat protein [Alphaproteobacteria bacterium ADurb.Bin100]